MPNIAKVFREEIARIARKEAKAAAAPLRKPNIRLRRDVADLKQRVATLEKENKQLQDRLAKAEAAQPAVPSTEPAERGWISGKGIKSLRKRLGLSQNGFAKLLGVTPQAVYLWEKRPGMLKLRDSTKASVFAIRGIGAREAKQRLEQLEKAKKPASKRGK